MRAVCVATSLLALAVGCALPDGGLGATADPSGGAPTEASAPTAQDSGAVIEGSVEAAAPTAEASAPPVEAGEAEAGGSTSDPGDDGEGDDGGDQGEGKGKAK